MSTQPDKVTTQSAFPIPDRSVASSGSIPKGVYRPNLSSRAFRTASGQPTELAEQFALVQWLASLRASGLVVPYFSVPNGGKRDHTEATLKLLEGLQRGVPDLWFPAARQGYHGLVIEMKVATQPADSCDSSATPAAWRRGVVSPDQKRWLDELSRERYFAVVCDGYVPAVKTVAWYFGIQLPTYGISV